MKIVSRTVNTVLSCNSIWLIIINIIIDNDKSQNISINLNFPVTSGSLIFPLTNTRFRSGKIRIIY